MFLKLIIFSANNLYGYAQSQSLPLKNFKWLKKEEIEKIDWLNIDIDKEIGYILEVDLEYPEELHESHHDFPLAPETKKIDYSMLSPYAKTCHRILKQNEKYESKKLISTFGQKTRYVLHFANLKLYLSLGLKLKHVYKVLRFQQSKFLKTYIDYCTEKRINSISTFQKNIWKLAANAVYGKFIQQTRNYLNCTFVRDKKRLQKLIAKPEFDSFKIINDNLVILFKKVTPIVLNKPYAIGFSVLELSKHFIYEQYYNNIKPKFESCEILFSDTDSLCMSVRKKSRKIDGIDYLKNIIDFSNYDSTHWKYNNSRKNQLGFFKDELKGKKLKEFIGLRSKTYCMKVSGNTRIKKAKGVTKGYQNKIPFKTFKKCLESISEKRISQYQIVSKNHKIRTVQVNKICFSSFDDKKYLFECGIHSTPYYSCLIKKYSKCPYCQNLL